MNWVEKNGIYRLDIDDEYMLYHGIYLRDEEVVSEIVKMGEEEMKRHGLVSFVIDITIPDEEFAKHFWNQMHESFYVYFAANLPDDIDNDNDLLGTVFMSVADAIKRREALTQIFQKGDAGFVVRQMHAQLITKVPTNRLNGIKELDVQYLRRLCNEGYIDLDEYNSFIFQSKITADSTVFMEGDTIEINGWKLILQPRVIDKLHNSMKLITNSYFDIRQTDLN